MTKRPLNLLWRRTTLDLVPEAYFIERVLLGALGRPVRTLTIERLADAPFVDDLMVVSLKGEFGGYLAEARRRGRQRLMLLHMGDEHGTEDRSFYDDADLVLRNYWFDAIFSDPKVHWIPNGYALGVGPAASLLRASERTIPGYFAGALAMRTLSDERSEMIAAVQAAALPFRIHVTATSRDRLGPMAYAAALGDSRFALVPGGNSPETIRMYDVLEMGCIPIMRRSGFVDQPRALGAVPFPLLDSWTELAGVYEPFAGDVAECGESLDRLQAEVIGWWSEFKRRQQQHVRTLIDEVLQD
jgi:hypothetical protein